jgi:hypothetical protein
MEYQGDGDIYDMIYMIWSTRMTVIYMIYIYDMEYQDDGDIYDIHI